ncbi:glycogen synthase [Streptomyces sp. NPDC059629]|uniref:glycogen synthase n=1 Tax=Streptomyces sp. NPDC059629 TaxID=3346889 RepID=UPI0036C99492
MKSLYITQEYAPLFGEGGLGLTSAALPAALHDLHGVEHDLVLPYYPWLVEQQGLRTEKVLTLPDHRIADVRARATVHRLLDGPAHGDLFLIRADPWYDRVGIYRNAAYRPFPDEAARAAFFGWCVAQWVARSANGYTLFHGNDWQSGAAMAHLRDLLPAVPQLLTIHNGLYQGRLNAGEPAGFGLPVPGAGTAEPDSMLLAAVLAADAAVTCSPGYARELLEETRGSALGDALRGLGLHGIVFGVDAALWNPAALDRQSVPFDASTVAAGKRLNKEALQKHLGLREDSALPVIGVCSRLVPEKGTDLLLEALAPLLLRERLQLVLVGPVDAGLRDALDGLVADAPGHVVHVPRFDQDLAWLLYAASDLTVMPSRAEPCGLNQLIAYRYGTLPVVSPVGGLGDTVTDLRREPGRGTGFVIPEHTVQSVRATILEALDWVSGRPERLAEIRRRVMGQDWSWSSTARAYADLYARISAAVAV